MISVIHILLLKGLLLVSTNERDIDEMNRQVILKNNAPFVSCILKINGILVENAEDVDICLNIARII